MRDHLLKTFASTLDITRSFMGDVPDERIAERPFDGAKNPGWIVGHHVVAAGMLAGFLSSDVSLHGSMSDVPEAIIKASSPGAEPTDDRAAYASKDALMAELERTHALVAERFTTADDAHLATQFPIEEYRASFPTIGAATFYLMARHEPYHLGQLSQWRRAAGLPGIDGS